MDLVELTGERVLLRPPTSADAEAVTAAIQDPEIPRWIDVIPWPYALADAQRFIQEVAQPGWESGSAPSWLITDRTSLNVLGSVGLTQRLPGVYEIGYWLAPAARGRGLMTESSRLACSYGFTELGASRIEWQAVVGNVASRRVVDRLGFTFEGVLRGRMRTKGRNDDCWIGCLLPDDAGVRAHERLLPWQPIELSDQDITLRAAVPAQAPWVAQAYADPQVRQWNPAPVTDISTAERWIRSRGDWAPGDHASWLFCDAADGRPMGSISLHKVNEENLTASIGYWTHPAEQGRGAATRAVQLVSSWALDGLGLKRVELIHAVANPASCRVAEKTGFTLEGTVRCGERYGDGQWYDEHIHGRVQPAGGRGDSG